MRKLSITLLLIALSFMTMEANILSSHRGKSIQPKIWDHPKTDIVFIPIEAMVIPDKQEIYKIDLDGFKADQYELFYIEKDVAFIGEFEIE